MLRCESNCRMFNKLGGKNSGGLLSFSSSKGKRTPHLLSKVTGTEREKNQFLLYLYSRDLLSNVTATDWHTEARDSDCERWAQVKRNPSPPRSLSFLPWGFCFIRSLVEHDSHQAGCGLLHPESRSGTAPAACFTPSLLTCPDAQNPLCLNWADTDNPG